MMKHVQYIVVVDGVAGVFDTNTKVVKSKLTVTHQKQMNHMCLYL